MQVYLPKVGLGLLLALSRVFRADKIAFSSVTHHLNIYISFKDHIIRIYSDNESAKFSGSDTLTASFDIDVRFIAFFNSTVV